MLRTITVFVLLINFVGTSQAESNKYTLQWLGHAAFEITSQSGKKILIDPFLTKNPKTPEKYKHYIEYSDVNVILITHAHGDHVGDAVDIAKKYEIPVYAPPGLNDTFVSLGLLPKKLAPAFNKGGSVFPFGENIQITMLHAEHSSEYKWQNPETGKTEVHEGGEPVSYMIRLEDEFTIYHMGDTGLFGDMEFIGQYYNPDVVLIPIGGNYTMDPVDAAYAVKHFLKPKYVVPMHYGTFPILKGTVEEFRKALQGSDAKLLEMLPGDITKF